jgi:hypothetical protein
MVRGHIHYIPESQVGKAIDMFNQYEAQFADISESQKMNSLMSSLNKATAIEHGPTSLQVSVVAAGGNSKSNSSEMSEAALVSMAKLGDSDAFVVLSNSTPTGSCGRSITSPGIGMMLKTRSRMQC